MKVFLRILQHIGISFFGYYGGCVFMGIARFSLLICLEWVLPEGLYNVGPYLIALALSRLA